MREQRTGFRRGTERAIRFNNINNALSIMLIGTSTNV